MSKVLLAKDTLISMADKTEKRICDIEAGDAISSPDGYSYTVTLNATGPSKKICIITTSTERKLRFAPNSKIESNDQVIYEDMFFNSNAILTITGLEEITDIKITDYDDSVNWMYLDEDAYIVANEFIIK